MAQVNDKRKNVNLHLYGSQVDDFNEVMGYYSTLLPNIGQQDAMRMLLHEKAKAIRKRKAEASPESQ